MTPDIERLSIDRVVIAHCRLPAWEANEHISSSARSSIGSSFTGQRCVVGVGGKTGERAVAAASLVVAGSEPLAWLRVDAPCELIEVSAEATLRREIADELAVGAQADLSDLAFPADSVAWAIAARLRACTRASRDADSLEVERLVRLLYGHVLRCRFGGRLREKGNGALDARRLRRVSEYVDANLGRPLRLNELADVAALSVFHFQRSFRRATGCSPRRYVALRRAEAAARELTLGRPADVIAARLGYASRARLRTGLMRELGRDL